MCDACERLLNRRTLLRGALAGGTALAVSKLWEPTAVAATAGDSTDFEFMAMGEDRLPATVTGATLRGGATRAGMRTSIRAGEHVPRPFLSPPLGRSVWRTSGSTSSWAHDVPPVGASSGTGLKAPPVAARAVWGANESLRSNDRAYAPVRKLIVHHSASDNKPADPASVVRLIQRSHTTGRGFSDTGYNYLIDHNGAIYEGRAARLYGPNEPISDEDSNGWGVVGAHAKGNNAGSCGICLIGNFDTGSPTDAAVASLVWLLAYKASRHRIDGAGNDEYIDLYGNHRVYANIAGHRQVGQTLCPGKNLYGLLPTIRNEVVRRAGHWDALTVNIPAVIRWEVGQLRSGGSSASGAVQSDSSAGATAGTTAPGEGGSSGTAALLIGVRVVSSVGRIYTSGKGTKHGDPSRNGSSDVVALANAVAGDGYWALDRSGLVTAFGGRPHVGDASGKGEAVDIASTKSGNGYWILMSNGGIYPFGDAGYASSPKRAGIGGTALRIAGRPQSDGYWVLMGDGTVHAFGAAPKFGAPSGSGRAVDVATTPSGQGYWVLTDAGVVSPFGDATDKGDLKRSSITWSKKKATHLVPTPSGNGYTIVNSEGSMLAFGDAPLFASFGGSGMTATGATPAFG